MSNFFDNDKLNLVVTCASGVERVLKGELNRLGLGEIPAVNGEFCFDGSPLDLVRCNLNLRTADRVYVKIAQFNALTFDELFEGVYQIDWKAIIPNGSAILVDGKCVKSRLFAVSACQSIVKKAIVKKLCGGKDGNLGEYGSPYKIFFSIFKDTVQILLNTSGVGLHKRGYRDMVGIAPIKETLASALLLMSDFYYARPFLDPFCGSGTLVIEGARIALNIAPGILRKFDFNGWKNFDSKLYQTAKEECLDKERRGVKLDFMGSDVDSKAVNLAKHHAKLAGLDSQVRFIKKDVKDLTLNSSVGTIVTNPPYGERVYDREQAEECYRNLGKVLNHNEGWSLFAITSAKNFEKQFGRKAERERKLYNSNKECRFYYYYGKGEKND